MNEQVSERRALGYVVVCGITCASIGGDLFVGQIAQLQIDALRNDDGSWSVSLHAHRPHPWSTGEHLAHVRRASLLECEVAIDRALADGAELRASARAALSARRAA